MKLNPGFLAILVITTLALAYPASADDKTFTRSDVLDALARKCVTPGLCSLSASMDQLNDAIRELAQTPCQTNLDRARTAWIGLNLAYKRNQMLTYGPIKGQIFWNALFYNRFDPPYFEAIIRGTQPINDELIEKMGANVKGAITLEYLLFGKASVQLAHRGADAGIVQFANLPSAAPQQPLDPNLQSLRRSQYLAAAAQNLDRQLKMAAQEGQAEDFPARFVKGKQDSMNLMVNELSVTIESGLVSPLLKQSLPIKPVSSTGDDAFPSGTIIAGMKASLDGIRDFYHAETGPGLGQYLAHVNPDLNHRIETQFKILALCLDDLHLADNGWEIMSKPAARNTLDEAHKLEILCKVDMASALGVTIMFTANDGD